MVRQAGYSSACAVRYNLCARSDDPFALPRLIVPGDAGLEHFAEILAGRGPRLDPSVERARAFAWRCARRLMRFFAESPGREQGEDHEERLT
jgi:hypothetical protein